MPDYPSLENFVIELENKNTLVCREIDDDYAKSAATIRETHTLDLESLRKLSSEQFVSVSRNHPLEVWFALIDNGLHHASRQMLEDVQITIAARFAGVEREHFLCRPPGEGLASVTQVLFPILAAFDQRQPSPETAAKIWRHGLEYGDLAAAVEKFTGEPVHRLN